MDLNTPQTGKDTGIAGKLDVHTEQAPGRRLRRILIWSIPIVLIAIGLLTWGLRGKSAPVRYKTQPARIGTITVTVSATGNLQPTNQVIVGSELSGTIKTVEVDYNDQVKVGQVLARLDTSKLSAQVLQSQAVLASAHAKVEQTRATIKETRAALERLLEVGRLSNNKAASKSDLETAQAARDRAIADEAAARAAVAQAEATLTLNRTDLAKAEIKSPINGIVLTRSVEPGQTVAASLQAPVLFTLAENLAQMDLHVDVDEADVGQVQAEQAAVFTVDAYPDRTYPAQITQVRFGSKTTNGVVTYETILQVDNSDLSLRPGMTATATITVTKVEDTLLVPNAALRFSPAATDKPAGSKNSGSVLNKLFPRPAMRPGKQKEAGGASRKSQQVWTLVNGKPVAVTVTTGLTDGSSTQIIAGDVKPGMELVTDTETTKK
jgi:HlyD family secretion protein